MRSGLVSITHVIPAKAGIHPATCADRDQPDGPRPSPGRRIKGSETGAAGGIEGLAFGVLIFVFGMIIVINAWAVIDGKIAASAAAREAVRAYVEAPTDAAGRAAASAAANAAVAGHNRIHAAVEISSSSAGAQYPRCAPVEARVTLNMPRLRTPLGGATGGTSTVTARHIEVIDPFRSGIAGTAGCSS